MYFKNRSCKISPNLLLYHCNYNSCSWSEHQQESECMFASRIEAKVTSVSLQLKNKYELMRQDDVLLEM